MGDKGTSRLPGSSRNPGVRAITNHSDAHSSHHTCCVPGSAKSSSRETIGNSLKIPSSDFATGLNNIDDTPFY
jgi:hypothetical protein